MQILYEQALPNTFSQSYTLFCIECYVYHFCFQVEAVTPHKQM